MKVSEKCLEGIRRKHENWYFNSADPRLNGPCRGFMLSKQCRVGFLRQDNDEACQGCTEDIPLLSQQQLQVCQSDVHDFDLIFKEMFFTQKLFTIDNGQVRSDVFAVVTSPICLIVTVVTLHLCFDDM